MFRVWLHHQPAGSCDLSLGDQDAGGEQIKLKSDQSIWNLNFNAAIASFTLKGFQSSHQASDISRYIKIYQDISRYIQIYPDISRYIQIWPNLVKDE